MFVSGVGRGMGWRAAALAAVLALAGCARAPLALPPLAADQGQVAGEPASDEFSEGQGDKQPYEDVITDEAETQRGLFIVHRVGDRTYFEIPADALGKDMLWHVETGASPTGLTPGRRVATNMVRLERRGDTIQVRDHTTSLFKRASDDGAGTELAGGIASATLAPVSMAFSVAADGPDGSAVIDVTEALASDDALISPRLLLQGYNLDPGQYDATRSYIESAKAFPRNVEVRSLVTYAAPDPSMGESAGSALSVALRHSLLALPDEPMRARNFDSRVGYFTVDYEDYSYTDDPGVVPRGQIQRYRLEKRDPGEEVSDPVEPIVFYLSRSIPDKWRPYIKRGVEEWQAAFEAAGFSNAIVARDAPSAEEDPTWDEADARHSVILWEYNTWSGGEADFTPDPRSGELLFSRVYLFGNAVAAFGLEYFVEVSPLDRRAARLPLPDDVLGPVLQSLTAHEIGHAIGLSHNFKASQAYTTAQLRDPQFVAENGIAASVMSYSPNNYVAQPEDGVDPKHLIARVGPYDEFAIRWGYRPIPDAETADDEAPTLDAWAAEQLDNPWLQFDEFDLENVDPTVLRFQLGSDRVESARLGLRNLERVMETLIDSTTERGDDYTQLANAYNMAMSMRANLIDGAAKMVAGVIETRALAGRTEAEFAPVPIAQQREALAFVLDQIETPRAFLRPDVGYRLQPNDVIAPLSSQQQGLLAHLLAPEKYRVLADQEMSQPGNGFTLLDYLSEVQKGVWRELDQPAPAVDPIRRALQRSYVERLGEQLNAYEDDGASIDDMFALFFGGGADRARGTDLRPAARVVLRDLLAQLEQAAPKAADAMTGAHLEDMRDEVRMMLEPQ